MSDRKNNFEKIAANQPKRTFTGPVMDERGKKDLPPGKKGGEKMKPDLHEIHKQHTFDSFCKKVLKHEAGNGHREINRRARIEISMSDLPEEAMEQLAVYDDYPWDYGIHYQTKKELLRHLQLRGRERRDKTKVGNMGHPQRSPETQS